MSESWKNNAGDDDVQMPLGTGGEGAEETAYREPKAAMNTSTLALIFSFIAALAVLYLLGLHNKPRSASAAETQHEKDMQTAISSMLQKNGKSDQVQNLFKDTDKLVQLFYHYLGSQASHSAELPGNPFAPDAPGTSPDPRPSEAVALVNNNAADAENLRHVAETFNSLKLQTVMVGKTSVAMINNRLVQVGGKIGELTVTSIEPGRVLLSYGKNTFELKLAGQSMENRNP